MSIKIIDGDLFSTKSNYICHQVNCQGKMGSGVAKQIRTKFPTVYKWYKVRCDEGAHLLMARILIPRLFAICFLKTSTVITEGSTQTMQLLKSVYSN